jgi:protein SCO1/2
MSVAKSLLVPTLVAAGVGAAVGVVLALSRGGASPATTERAAGDLADVPSEVSAAAGGAGVTNPYSEFEFGAFSLTSHTGDPIDASILTDERTVVAFFFTSCRGPCPELTRLMRTIQDETEGTGARLLSISVDGDHDTPEVLRGYAELYGADLSRWTFATGDPAAVAELAREALSFTISRQADNTVPGPGGIDVPNVIHPTRLLLVGPDRRVIGVYAYNDPAQIEALTAAARG